MLLNLTTRVVRRFERERQLRVGGSRLEDVTGFPLQAVTFRQVGSTNETDALPTCGQTEARFPPKCDVAAVC
jgi:hypothetical protein